MFSALDPHPGDLPAFRPSGSILGFDASVGDQAHHLVYFPPPIAVSDSHAMSHYLVFLARALLHSPPAFMVSLSQAIALHPSAPLCAGLVPNFRGPFADVLLALSSNPHQPPYAEALEKLSEAEKMHPQLMFDLLAVRALIGLLAAWVLDGVGSLGRGEGELCTLRLITMAIFTAIATAESSFGALCNDCGMRQLLSTGAAMKPLRAPGARGDPQQQQQHHHHHHYDHPALVAGGGAGMGEEGGYVYVGGVRSAFPARPPSLPEPTPGQRLVKDIYDFSTGEGCDVWKDTGRCASLSTLTLAVLEQGAQVEAGGARSPPTRSSSSRAW